MIENVQEILNKQNEFFDSGKTRDVNFRLEYLKKLKKNIIAKEKDILSALYTDLSKSELEAYATEIGTVLSELSYMIKNAKRLSKTKYMLAPMSHFPGKLMETRDPYGCVLVISPWNFPFQLTLMPIIDAVAAGNTIICKPSKQAPAIKEVMKNLIAETFPPEYVTIISGGRDENADLLDLKYDYIFFTGSVNIGKYIMSKAAPNLTPVSLELGGKSPCIVDKSCNLDVAVNRIVFGKFTNAGQICVAPDYLLVHDDIVDTFIEKVKSRITEVYSNEPLSCPHFPKIINDREFDRVVSLIDPEKVVFGGKYDKSIRKIEPTIMKGVTLDDKVMSMEIFGPIMPIITFNDHNNNLKIIEKHSRPLALYVFTENKNVKDFYIKNVRYGGGCVNDTLMHTATHKIGFGGVGYSGIGQYHGKHGFDTFTHYKGIVDSATWMDMPARYLPATKSKMATIKLAMK